MREVVLCRDSRLEREAAPNVILSAMKELLF
jgi:hypothetical protein